ncbi:TraU family protein (plasmid) [Cupriavidus metallidurans]|jgi:conjugal transfer pilus assembly protein TraU|uniref:Sex pilus assembly and synthesis protein n=1 Tax=Cupriavidus metallidurans (strain ATCC 43123 / DSM 2839 / NBRC 102507 / CH34) TaxID=266264 RepID=Q58AH6_CUPMC|nr:MULTISPECIES: TraU family protein [Cupriavidus]ABF13026.1 TraU sex pilus assembly and synthesis protein [Cupriavidus metallidurans CH34]QGS31104.1 conjugal transfer protein TraU [Cupriavidus metallidurans]CAI11291.1 sex pilus assembly and synthesis protein [Cupriavidus metallidurans CH34]
MKKLISAALLLAGALFGSGTANADALCTGKFPNLISDVCWSCMMPIKLFGTATLLGGGQDDFDSGPVNPICFCQNPPKVGIPTSFWEFDMMTDVTAVPGCFPLLGGVRVNTGVNADAFGQISDDQSGEIGSTRTSFMQVNLYINPALYVMGAILDDSCLDQRGIDIPWVSFADPTHNDDELAGIIAPYAFPFGGMVAIGAMSADAVAATAGFPIPEIFWAAGAYGHMYPLTGNNEAHLSMEQTARLQTTRVLAKLHAAGTQWSAFGSDAMCGYYPQIIMDKRQYKFTRLYPIPQTVKIAGKCCDPIGRSPILTQTNTELPMPGWRDFGYAIFRKRDCCSGASPG